MGTMPDVSLSPHRHWQVDRAVLVSPLGNGKHHKISSAGRCLSNRTQAHPFKRQLLQTSPNNDPIPATHTHTPSWPSLNSKVCREGRVNNLILGHQKSKIHNTQVSCFLIQCPIYTTLFTMPMTAFSWLKAHFLLLEWQFLMFCSFALSSMHFVQTIGYPFNPIVCYGVGEGGQSRRGRGTKQLQTMENQKSSAFGYNTHIFISAWLKSLTL